jgi:GNAT superfamily N-acetyltransferase
VHLKIQIRVAVAGDIPALKKLIDASVRVLEAADYSAEQLEAVLKSVIGVDTQLIADGTYFVAEVDEDGAAKHVIAGCGGWSKRRTLFGGDVYAKRDDDLLDPRSDAAKIRAFFVHPAWARRGIGSMILEACETAAKSEGFTRFEMGSTLTGVPLYRARGYAELERVEVSLPGGILFTIVHMAKNLREGE